MSSCSSLFCCCRCQKDDSSLHQEARMHGNHDQNQHYDQEAKAGGNSTTSENVLIVPIYHGDGEANPASKVEEQRKNKLDVAAKAVAWEGHAHDAANNDPEANKEGTKSGHPSNDLFSDYIHRAKMKIRSMTLSSRKNAYNADDVHNTQKENHPKETFSQYIDRTKMKIRKKPSMNQK